MEESSTLVLWTTYLGWHYYNVIYGLLVATFVAIVPIAWTIINHLIEARSRGSLMSQESESVFAGIEIKLFLIMVVILLAVRPSGLTALTSSSFQFTPQSGDGSSNLEVRTPTDTRTNLDGITPSRSYNVFNETIPIPPLWYLVMQISSGFSFAIASNIDQQDDVYRSLVNMVNRVSITDPAVNMIVSDFSTQCYLPALSYYRRLVNNNNNELRHLTLADREALRVRGGEGTDVNWIGSSILQDNFYNRIVVDHPVASFPFQANVDTQFADGSIPSQGAPSCQDYWIAIRETLQDESDRDGLAGFLDAARDQLGAVVNADPNSPNYKDDIARIYLSKNELTVSRTADQILANRSANAGVRETIVREVAETIQVWEIGKLAAAAELFVNVLINALVYVHAYTLMILYLSIPLILVFSGYSVAAVTGVTAMIFVLKFLPVVWLLIAWIDNTFGLALWQGKSLFGSLISFSNDEMTSRFTHSVSVALLYGASSAIFLGIFALSGIRSAFALANMGRNLSGAGGGITALGPGAAATAAFAGQAGRAGSKTAAEGVGLAVAAKVGGAGTVARLATSAAVSRIRG